jgi:hypothetical protein
VLEVADGEALAVGEGSHSATPATNQQIAEELHLSVSAVKTHPRALFQAIVDDDPFAPDGRELGVEARDALVPRQRDLALGVAADGRRLARAERRDHLPPSGFR